MGFDKNKGYVPMPPNQNGNTEDKFAYKDECIKILKFLLESSNTNNGIFFFEDVTKAFPNIAIPTLNNYVFPLLKVKGYIDILNGQNAPTRTTKIQFRISDEGKLFLAQSVSTKGIKDFVFELLQLLQERGTDTDISEFIEQFIEVDNIKKFDIKMTLDRLVKENLIECVGYGFLAMSSTNLHSIYMNPPIHAILTIAGERYFKELKEEKTDKSVVQKDDNMNKDFTEVFIVHGHNNEAKIEVARFLERLGIAPIILHEQVSEGMTIIEKIEKYSNVAFGIVLYTPCDVGAVKGMEVNLNARARQNVVFEHGYLIGKIGRKHVCALVKGELEKPNDISGVVYVDMDANGAWRFTLGKELKACGYDVDMNKL